MPKQNKPLDDIISRESDTINIQDKSELGEVFDNLDNDKMDKDTRMSKIDFNTRLTDNMIRNITIFEEFQQMGIMPVDSKITDKIKRLNVSLKGEGRKEKERIASASRMATMSGRSGGFLSNLFSPKE